jgi:hypothetical protein
MRTAAQKFLAKAFYPLVILGLAAFFVLMSPIIFYPVAADDAYWLLLQPDNYNNSLSESFLRVIESSYSFTGQPRTTSLAVLIRVWQAMFVMNTAIFFAISPALVWSGIKIFLMMVVIATLWLFLKKYRYRSRSGEVINISSKTRRTIIVFLPILIATGFEVPSAGLSNGWLFYPLLTYLPIAIAVLVALGLIKSHDLLTRNFARNALPVSAFLFFLAWALNLSYELWLISVPFALLVLLLDPVSKSKGLLGGLMPKLWAGGVFGGAFSAIFIWTRIQINMMPCFDNNTCYDGTVIELNLENIIKNFTSALPGQGFERMFLPETQTPSRSLVAVAVAASVALLLALLAYLTKLRSLTTLFNKSNQEEVRALLTLASLMFFLAISSAIVTGITERAGERLIDPINPYRSGPTISISLSVAAAALAIILIRYLDGQKFVTNSIKIVGASLIVVLSASNFAMNNQETRNKASSPHHMITQALHREIALGATGKESVARRCLLIEEAKSVMSEDNQVRFIPGAERAFALYWGTPFCSTQSHKTVDISNIDG